MTNSSLPSASAYHRLPIRLFNGVYKLLSSVGLINIRFDEETVIAAAKKQTGLHDFGDNQFLVPMRILIQSLETEAELNGIGRFMNKMNIVRLLKHRLYVQDLLQKHPEILERKIPDPVVIVGLARSGTTRLHRLLASDENFLHLKSWETVNPVPYPESFSNAVDPRITVIEQGLKAVLYMAPQMAAVHPLGTFEVEEEIGLLQHSFSSQIFEIQAKMPSFANWLMTNDQTSAYEYMVVLMKIISWYRDDPEDKPWVMKTPQHMQDLDALLNVFPSAKLIFTHRDPVKVMGSTCSMAWNAIVRDSNSVSAQWVGQEWFEKTQAMLHKTMAIRAASVAPENQLDVYYADITVDWQQSMQGIYDFLGITFSEQAKQGMQEWLHSNGQHKYGTHKYSLADFGLDEAEVEQALQFYRQHYQIPFETKNPHNHQ